MTDTTTMPETGYIVMGERGINDAPEGYQGYRFRKAHERSVRQYVRQFTEDNLKDTGLPPDERELDKELQRRPYINEGENHD